jgi:hypothetical protein
LPLGRSGEVDDEKLLPGKLEEFFYGHYHPKLACPAKSREKSEDQLAPIADGLSHLFGAGQNI